MGEQGANIKSVFGRLQKAVNAINEKLEFAYNEQLGYLTACPTNIGCGERASVHIKVPLTSQNEELFKEIATRNNLQIRGVHGEHSESKGGVYDVSNKRRLGISEWDGIKDLINGCRELIESETKLQKEANQKKEAEEKKKKKKEKKKEVKDKKTKKDKNKKDTKSPKKEKEKKEKKEVKDKKSATKEKKKKTEEKSDKKEKAKKGKKESPKAEKTKTAKKKKGDKAEKAGKAENKRKKKGAKDPTPSKEKAGDLKDWMDSNDVYDKALYSALTKNGIKGSAKIKAMDQATFDGIVRQFRIDRFAKIKKKAGREKIDKLLVNFEKSWMKLKKDKASKKKKKKKQKK